MSDESNGRTHEPSLRELTSDLDGLKELTQAKLGHVQDILDERDKLYKERDDARRVAVDAALAAAKAAVDAALIAVKEQTKQSFDASEKAIVKAEEAQKAYNASHNDLARKMDEQNKATMPRAEIETRFKSLEEKTAILTGSFVSGTRAAAGAKSLKDESRANFAIIISIIVAALAVISFFIKRGGI